MPTLHFANRIEFDFGARRRLPDAMAGLGVRRPLVCTDAGLVAAGVVATALEGLPDARHWPVFGGTPPNPTEASVRSALERFRAEGCDGVLGLGGGASIDLAKAVALAASHPGPLLQYGASRKGIRRIGAVVPIVAMPTTAGTGSEATPGSVIIVDEGFKEGLVSPHLLPRIAICDPELTLTLPRRMTVATGMDAVAHCIEGIVSTLVNPPAEAIGYDGLHRALRTGALEAAADAPDDRTARWHMMMAATEGALCLVKGLGAAHSLSHATTAVVDDTLHHGTLNAAFLPWVLEFNAPACQERYARIREVLGRSQGCDIAAGFEAIVTRLGVPVRLSEFGVRPEHVEAIAGMAATDICTATNPRPASSADLADILRRAL